ncbi:hypothetical protein DICVIV_03351 [Dictyocaulus viviparus]|uniref:Uncharacterized protein n=1 Tax=Dictyocaulus viviparus TaxID=29172 RepID=A0A0D8Y7C9_DICVI|nr:hypothetical protein DICVIV_03351 [Dictyocaulus viviparus]
MTSVRQTSVPLPINLYERSGDIEPDRPTACTHGYASGNPAGCGYSSSSSRVTPPSSHSISTPSTHSRFIDGFKKRTRLGSTNPAVHGLDVLDMASGNPAGCGYSSSSSRVTPPSSHSISTPSTHSRFIDGFKKRTRLGSTNPAVHGLDVLDMDIGFPPVCSPPPEVTSSASDVGRRERFRRRTLSDAAHTGLTFSGCCYSSSSSRVTPPSSHSISTPSTHSRFIDGFKKRTRLGSTNPAVHGLDVLDMDIGFPPVCSPPPEVTSSASDVGRRERFRRRTVSDAAHTGLTFSGNGTNRFQNFKHFEFLVVLCIILLSRRNSGVLVIFPNSSSTHNDYLHSTTAAPVGKRSLSFFGGSVTSNSFEVAMGTLWLFVYDNRESFVRFS